MYFLYSFSAREMFEQEWHVTDRNQRFSGAQSCYFTQSSYENMSLSSRGLSGRNIHRKFLPTRS